MQILGIAIVSIAFLIALWLLWKRLDGGAGPVIIITPPDVALTRNQVGWKLNDGKSDVEIEFHDKLNEKIPAHLLGTIGQVDVKVKRGNTPVGFQSLRLSLTGKPDVILSGDDDGRLRWETHLGSRWKSSAGKLTQWPAILKHEATEIEFVDAEDTHFRSADISEITITMKY